MNNRILVLLAAFTLSVAATAQTARSFKVKMSADGASEMEVFMPANPTGRAIVDCPGGGYSHLSMQNEGTDWAAFFNEQGITFGVLKYRMPKGDRSLPMSDAFNAVKMMRDSADVWGVNPNDVGIMGFSAGGHLASTVATHAETLATRPDFQILFYPVISMDERETHKGSCVGFLGDLRSDEKLVKEFSNYNKTFRHVTPPAIILMSQDDNAVPIMTNGWKYYEALTKTGIPSSLHIYPTGGHGWGFRSTFAYHETMKKDLLTWLDNLKMPRKGAVRVACIGNSITDGAGLKMVDASSYPAQLQRTLGSGYKVGNFGVSGRTMQMSGDRPYMKEKAWKSAKEFAPQIAVIKLGTNDSKPKNWNEKDYERDLQTMIDELNALDSKPTIYLCTPLQCNHVSQKDHPAASCNNETITNSVIPIINRVAQKNRLAVIDLNPLIDPASDEMQSDHLHPTNKGASKMAKTIAEAIRK